MGLRQTWTSRRNFLTISTGGMAAAGCLMRLPDHNVRTPLSSDRQWRTALCSTLRVEHDYRPRVEGALPAGFEGRLYRNGPGLFERNGYHKQHLLDGDGMLQCFDFSSAGVRYRNRFVRTDKFIAEETAGAFIYPTWTTRAPGGTVANFGGRIKSQAGVTTLVRDGRLLALDEVIPAYVLDPATLETIGRFTFPEGVGMPGCKAHTKTDPRSGDWILAATDYGRTMTLRWLVLARDGTVKAQGAVMRGEDGEAEFPGTIRRYVIDLKTKALRQEIIDTGNHEFPMIDLRVGLGKHRYGYFACGRSGDWILDGVARVDMDSGARKEFRFGPRHFVSEPIFAPRGSSEDDGWILTQVQSGETGKSFLAVFDARDLAAGPIAKVHLRHHVPLSFHGFWDAGA